MRESLRLVYSDGGHLYLGSVAGILDLTAVRDMTFETLPINDSVGEFDMAFDGNNTWLATRGTEQIVVSGLGRFPRTEAAVSGDLFTPHVRPPSKTEECYYTFVYVLLGVFHGPIDPDPEPAIHSIRSSQNHRRTQAQSASAATSDLDALRAVRTLMLRTPEGQRLEALYRQFSPDAAAVAASHPKLLIDTIATVRNFLPGLIAYASGSGSRSVITRGMIDQLNNLWSGLANRGSPALKSALLAERDRFHGFEDFVGKSFDQWAEQLQFPKTATSSAPFRIVASDRTAAGFSVTVEGLANSTLRLERTERLGSATWAPVVNSAITPDGNRVRLTDPAPPAGHAFYRVTAIPVP